MKSNPANSPTWPYRRFTSVLILFLILQSPLVFSASRHPVRAADGMVVTSDPLASEVGLEILKRGGHAVDAAVAVGFALAVVYPSAGNIGGGGFMVVHEAEEGNEVTIDFREKAPLAAHRSMYLDNQEEVIENLSRVGRWASGVPGTVAGLHLAWERYGRLSWSDLLQPAIQLASEGFEISYFLSSSLAQASPLLSRFEESRKIYLRNGQFYREGEVFQQKDLGKTLELIARQGPEAFYQGQIARLIARDMQDHGGLITLEDLKNYQAKVRPPVLGTYRGNEIVSMGPPSSGGVILVEMLNMIEPFPLSRLGFNSSDTVHLKAEVMKRAFADRAEFLGDQDYVDVPTERLTSKEYARKRSREIDRGWATPAEIIAPGEGPVPEAMETTHYSIVDSQGNGVAVTTTINGAFGSGVTVPGGGFLLNNEMDDFSAKPGAPNMYGLLQGEANAIQPGKRPLSAMTPTLVKKQGKLFMILGSPGGPTIINTVFQIISNVIDFKLDIQEAVDASRVHHQWIPDEIVAEERGLVRDVVRSLEARGHRIRVRPRIGDAHAILIDPDTGMRLGAPDPRSNSKASGY